MFNLFNKNTKNLKQINLEDKVLYFVHIPKTGGTTLSGYLKNQFTEDELFPKQLWYHLLPPWPFETKQYRFIRGHFGNRVEDFFPNRELVKITMLRDPVERTISQFHHMHSIAGKPDDSWVPKWFCKEETTLEEIVFDPHKSQFFYNTQARYLASNVNAIEKTKNMVDKTQYFFDIDPEFLNYNLSDHELLRKAKNNLEQYGFVGFTEQHNKSILMLSYIFGWKPIIDPEHLMVKPGRPPREAFSEKVINRIKELTSVDQELYNDELKKFNSRFANLKNTLSDGTTQDLKLTDENYVFERLKSLMDKYNL